jgi:Sulfatase
MPIVEYDPGAAFPGVIGRTAEESSPAWPAPARAPKGSPNVLMIVLDDTGFGHLGCYGSPIETPHFDGIAASGLRYNSMHTTALCSPSRSCIVTGRNHHANGMACIAELATGFPGYNGVMPFENGMLSEILVEQGYSTFMVGKSCCSDASVALEIWRLSSRYSPSECGHPSPHPNGEPLMCEPRGLAGSGVITHECSVGGVCTQDGGQLYKRLA